MLTVASDLAIKALWYLSVVLIKAILVLLGLYVVFALNSILIQAQRIRKAPPNIPWAGVEGRRWLPHLRATLGEFTAGKKHMQEGWDKYSKNGHAFILPNRIGPEIILPPSHVPWIKSQPETILNFDKVLDDNLALDWLGHGPDKAYVLDHAVIRRDMTRSLLKLTPQVFTEVEAAFNDILANVGSEWVEVPLIKHLETVTHRATAVFIVGEPLCHDAGYLEATSRWMMAYGIAAFFNRCWIPDPLRPFWGPVFKALVLPFQWLAIRRILPIVQARLSKQQGEKAGDELKQPNDVLQWVIDDLANKRPASWPTAWDVCGKTIMTEFLALHTTNLSLARILLDILSHPTATDLLPQLSLEASQILSFLPTDPTALRAMPKFDSVIRETTNYHPMLAHTLQRTVVAPEGVSTPDGLFLAQGSHLATFDPALFDGTTMYTPLRSYEQPKLQYKPADDNPDESLPPLKQHRATDISDSSLAFGQGRHACPGRFFAVHVIKLILGSLLAHYEFEPLRKEPKWIEIGETEIPSPKIGVRMRRRQGTAGEKASDPSEEKEGESIVAEG